MRILIVMAGPAFAEARDVVASRTPALLDEVAGLGVVPEVVLLGDPEGLRDRLPPQVRVHVVGSRAVTPSAGGALLIPGVVPGVRRLIRTRRPDVVEGDEPLPAIAAGIAARGCGARVVYRRHHVSRSRGLVAASRIAARLADRTIVSNDAARAEAVRTDRVDGDRVLIAGSGAADLRRVEPGETDRLRSRLGIPAAAPVVVGIGRLRAEKGFDVLVEAARGMPREAHVAIVGNGPERRRLAAMTGRSEVPVHLVGHQADIAPWLALADVVAVPSRCEAFGRVPVEAMAAGRAVVASRTGGLALAVVDGETGVLVEPEDPGALAAAVSGLLADPDRRGGMALAARRRFESRHTLGAMARSWCETWEAALA